MNTRAVLCLCLLLVTGELAKASILRNNGRQSDGETLRMLDAMEQLMEGGTEFDRVYYPKLEQCWNTINPSLKQAQDNAWAGFVQYHDQDGVPGDEWGSCLGEGHCVVYFEQNATQQVYHNVTIYEPCNYASNVAYYHTTTEVCSHLGNWAIPADVVTAYAEIMSSLSFGSHFWHGSHTYVGNVLDNRFIEVLAFILHQVSLANLNSTSPVIMDLSDTPRPYTGVELNAQVTDMFLNSDVSLWADTILNLDMPTYYMSFAGLVVTSFTLFLDDATADDLIARLIVLFNFPEEETDFMLNKYIPEIRPLLAPYKDTTGLHAIQMRTNFESALIKMLYAFLWQEWAVTSNPIIYDPDFNAMGAQYLPIVNGFANALNNWPEYEQDLQNSVNIYPGDVACNNVYPHAKWHQEAAAGLIDLIYFSNDNFVATLAPINQ